MRVEEGGRDEGKGEKVKAGEGGDPPMVCSQSSSFEILQIPCLRSFRHVGPSAWRAEPRACKGNAGSTSLHSTFIWTGSSPINHSWH